MAYEELDARGPPSVIRAPIPLGNKCNGNRAQDLPTAEEVEAQGWSTYAGKVLRMNLDGAMPEDNPVIDGTRSHSYSYGHRNAQGLVFGEGGELYANQKYRENSGLRLCAFAPLR
ncbi:PQQ-dependent sugar dehydrogenase [Sorangium sp. So ce131]|uniref:PQQ-dependent sugar dehydrogenase n=1 Tax=Sorangium sp. So ce131 TaxID=3133282 RepID=UPI003F636613